jgi:uncharacterized protein YjiS (DUF1127 family)
MNTIAAAGEQALPMLDAASAATGSLWASHLANWLGGLHARGELSSLDGHMLKDIGVTREVSCEQLRFETEQRLWLA